MTKQEAIQAMKDGKKITHRSFTDNEFITSDKKGLIYTTEEGYIISANEFWSYRASEYFQTDWELYINPAAPSIEPDTVEGFTGGSWFANGNTVLVSLPSKNNNKEDTWHVAQCWSPQARINGTDGTKEAEENAKLIAQLPTLKKERDAMYQALKELLSTTQFYLMADFPNMGGEHPCKLVQTKAKALLNNIDKK